MKNELQEKMIQSLSSFRLPRYAEITNVGLYLEQTVKFINAYLEPLGGLGITTSMVSNYVKQKLIANPDKKQYYTEHIAYLMFIALTKTVVSLEDIRMMIHVQQEHYSVQTAYDYFCDEFERLLKTAFGIVAVAGSSEGTRSSAKDLLKNTIITAVYRIYLDKYLAMFRESETE